MSKTLDTLKNLDCAACLDAIASAVAKAHGEEKALAEETALQEQAAGWTKELARAIPVWPNDADGDEPAEWDEDEVLDVLTERWEMRAEELAKDIAAEWEFGADGRRYAACQEVSHGCVRLLVWDTEADFDRDTEATYAVHSQVVSPTVGRYLAELADETI